MKQFLFYILLLTTTLSLAQEIPEPLCYTQIYSFLDELATDGIIDINSGVCPFTRRYIGVLLNTAATKDSLLSPRQHKDLLFYLNEFALERDTMENNYVQHTNHNTFNVSLGDPQFSYSTPDRRFKMKIRPIIGMQVYGSKKGAIIKRWWGAELQMDIVKHISLWGSLRDISYNGKSGLRSKYYPTAEMKRYGARLTEPNYLNNLPGMQYKWATYGGDFSDSKGGIAVYAPWGSIAFQRENIQWGDAYHCSNILSGRAPAVPMLTLHLQPCNWFEFNYFHAWLISNVLDSTNYYLEDGIKEYRPHSKYMAANMFSFTPVHHLKLSIGNSIVYAENHPQAAYFIPIAFFKSLDHLLTEGAKTGNQNSQLFFTVSTRNIPHLHLYTSVYIDEIKGSRVRRSNPERNPVSYLVGFNWSGWPIQGLSWKGEFTRTNIICYKHSVETLTWASNGYNLGHYLGDNAQSIYTELSYKPVRGLNVSLSYTLDCKYNSYNYLRENISTILAQEPYDKLLYRNDIVALNAIYELLPHFYITLDVSYNYVRTFDNPSTLVRGENTVTAKQYMSSWVPVYFQGRNLTTSIGLSFNF